MGGYQPSIKPPWHSWHLTPTPLYMHLHARTHAHMHARTHNVLPSKTTTSSFRASHRLSSSVTSFAPQHLWHLIGRASAGTFQSLNSLQKPCWQHLLLVLCPKKSVWLLTQKRELVRQPVHRHEFARQTPALKRWILEGLWRPRGVPGLIVTQASLC